MPFFLEKTIESPCRTCDNVHLNKEECAGDCEKIRAFQQALVSYEERNIVQFGLRYNPPKD